MISIFFNLFFNNMLFSFIPLHFSLVKPLKIYQDLQDMTVLLGQPIKLHCEIYPGNVPGRWYRNGQLIQPNDRINIIHRNKYVFLLNLVTQKQFHTTANYLFFQGPPTRNWDQLSAWCRRLHVCTWGIFTESLCQTPHHWYTNYFFGQVYFIFLYVVSIFDLIINWFDVCGRSSKGALG